MAGRLIHVFVPLMVLGIANYSAAEDREIGRDAFEKTCSGCHSASPVPRAMSPAQMAELPPEKIFKAQTEGLMVLQASALTELEQRALAIYVSKTSWGSVPEEAVTENLTQCASTTPLDRDALEKSHWSGWGLDLDNTHSQSGEYAGLGPKDLQNLEFKWALGYGGATTVTTQPAVAGGRIYIGGPNGGIYALDAKTGCAHWKFETADSVRGAITMTKLSDGRLILLAGDRDAWFYAVDADSGEQLWKDKVEKHEWALVTGSASLYDGLVYVPVSSFEELAGGSLTYECCTFRGSVVAYDIETGKRVWKSSTVLEELVKTKKMANGVQLWGPSGVAVWSQPTIDPKAGVLYVTTGDSYSSPASATSDAIIAMDLKTGEIKWYRQTYADDAFTSACVAPNADPIAQEGCGPDVDYGSSAILRTLPNGRRILLAGQKSGVLHGLDPDNKGETLWQKQLSPGGVLGGIEWGFTADEKNVYVPISDVWENRTTPGHAGGIYAINFADGSEVWNTPAAKPDCLDRPGCNAGQPAAATLIPGVIFSGSMDGHMRAYDPADGKVIWDTDTKREYPTVNDVTAVGGSIKGAGVTVVDGWIYFGSGYGLWGLPGNVFLAFGPK